MGCTDRGRDCGLRRGVDTIRRVVSNALRRSVYTDLRTRQTPLKTMGCRRPFLRDWRSRARSLAGAQPVVFRRPTLLLPWTLFRARHPGNVELSGQGRLARRDAIFLRRGEACYWLARGAGRGRGSNCVFISSCVLAADLFGAAADLLCME